MPPTQFTGSTSQRTGGYPGNQRLPSNRVAFTYTGGLVRNLNIPWVAQCFTGSAAPLLDRVVILDPIAVRDGSFGVQGSYQFVPGPRQRALVEDFSLRGTVRNRRAVGTASVTVALQFTGLGQAHCAQHLRWSAVARTSKVDLAFPRFSHPQRYFPQTPMLYTQTTPTSDGSATLFTYDHGSAIFSTYGYTYGGGVRVTTPPLGSSDSHPSASERGGPAFAFQRTVGGVSQIYLGGAYTTPYPDGRETGFPAGAQDPAMSPDGTRIVFSVITHSPAHSVVRTHRPVNCSLWIMNWDGTSQHRLTDHGTRPGCDESPVWSPDSRLIAFQRTRADASGETLATESLIVSAAGGTAHAVRMPVPASALSWAPDPKLVFISLGRPGHLPSLRTINPDGTDDRTVLRTAGLTGRPAWLPPFDGLPFDDLHPNTPPEIAITLLEHDGNTRIALVSDGGGKPIDWENTPGTSASDPTPFVPDAETSPSSALPTLHVMQGPPRRVRPPPRRRRPR